MKNKNNKKMSYTARGTPSNRDREARERLQFKPKKILIYGDMCKTPSNSGKLIYQLAKVMQARKHEVMTIGMRYNGIQMYDDNIPILPSFFCEECGNKNPGKQIQKIADYITYFNPDYFICVGGASEMQSFALGNFDWSKMRAASILYLTDIEYPINIRNAKKLERVFNLKNPIKTFDNVVVMGELDKQRIKETWSIDSSVIYPGIDLDYYTPVDEESKQKLREKYGFEEEDYVIYTCSEPTPILMDNLIPIMVKHPTINFLFNVNKEIDSYKSLFENIKKTNPEESKRLNIMKTGLVTAQSPNFYQMSDLFLSLKESADLRIIEALACGVKIISGGAAVAAFNLSKSLGLDDTYPKFLDLKDLGKLINKCISNSTDKNLPQVVDLLNKDYFGQFWANLIQNINKKEEK